MVMVKRGDLVSVLITVSNMGILTLTLGLFGALLIQNVGQLASDEQFLRSFVHVSKNADREIPIEIVTMHTTKFYVNF